MKKGILVTMMIMCGCVIVSYVAFSKPTKPIPDEMHVNGLAYDSNIESFLKKHLFMKEGIIRTDFEHQPEGNIALSESVGLWLEYLAEKGDRNQFERAFQAMKGHFQLKNKLIAWRIDNGKKADTNALIDDLRIIEALFKMGEQTNNDDYLHEAIAMSQAVLKYNNNYSFLVDFYDVNYKEANETLTISYLNYDAIIYMEKYNVIKPKLASKIIEFMKDLPIENGFYPQTYDVKKNLYDFNQEINLIDQLYITLHLEKAGIKTDVFYQWLKDTFYEKHHLYGRYSADTKENTVAYEAAAVYALATMYSLEKGDKEFAKDLYTQMMTLQVQDEASTYYGGFIDEGTLSTHPFDNLLVLLAERNLVSENIIP